MANGERQSVAIDAQGDMVAKSESSPGMATPAALPGAETTPAATAAGTSGAAGSGG
jgi:hypothetical protein